MEKLNNMTLEERLENHKTEYVGIRRPKYQFGNGTSTNSQNIGAKTGKKKFILKRDVFIEWEMLDSEAFKSLSARAIRVLIRFLQKRTWTNKKTKTVYHNNGLVFTYPEAEEMGISRSRFHDIIKELYAVGFIEIEHQGGGLAKDFSRYALSERWKEYGSPSFKHVTKKKTCRAGHDVHSRKQALKQVTENSNSQLRKIVSIGGFDNQQGIGKQ